MGYHSGVFPLDAASDRFCFLHGDGLVGKQRIDRVLHIFFVGLSSISRIVVDSSYVGYHKFILPALEYEDMGSIGCAERLGYTLIFVQQVREIVFSGGCAGNHIIERISRAVIRVDGDNGKTFCCISLVKGDDPVVVGFRIGTGISVEDEDDSFLLLVI